MIAVVAYDIADDRRRSQVSAVLEAVGARVQLSIFEVEFDGPAVIEALRGQLLDLLDTEEDQLRIYEVAAQDQVSVIGARRIEELEPFLII